MKSSKMFKFSIAIIVFVLIASLCSIGILTYARLRTANVGEVEASIAKWSFKVNGEEEVFADIVIENTIDNVNIADKKLAPGTYGDFTIEIDGTGSEVSLMYFVKISNFENKPTNLIFYADEECTKEYELQEDGSLQTAGKILLDDIDSIRYEKVYWRWEYTTGGTDEEIRENNVIDTGDAGAEMTARVTVVGIQMNEDSEELVDGRKVYFKENDEIVIPFKVRTDNLDTSAEVYKLATISDVSLNSPDPLSLTESNVIVRVDDEVVNPTKKVLAYKATRNGVANYELTVSGINKNGKIEIEVIKDNLDKIFTTTKYIDSTVPTMVVTPESAAIGENMNVTITVSDNNFAEENEYEYYISNSSNALEGGQWISYNSGDSFEIKNNGNANRYVWVKSLQDKAGNETSYTTILNNAKYCVKGPYQFDVVKPVIQSGGDIEIVEEDEDGTVYDIPIEVVEEGGYVENEELTNLTLQEVQIWMDGELIEPRSKSLSYEYTAQNKHMYTLRIKLRTWGEMFLKFAQDVIVDTSGNKNEETEVEIIDIYADMDGSGTVDDPYIIKTVKHLKEVVDNPSLYYKLGRNISLVAEENWEIIGKTNATAFSGGFNGDGHTISDITINTQNNYAGLFGYNTGVIENLTLTNVDITGQNYVGGLAGYSTGTIRNCEVRNGSVTGQDYVGGLIGQSAIAHNCKSNVTVNGRDYVGGLVGLSSGTVSKSYTSGNVSGRNYIGGLIGRNNDIVQICYATGQVYGTSESIGGLIGYQNGVVENTFATGKVTTEYRMAGSLIGYKNAELRYSYGMGEVVGENTTGGLMGRDSGSTVYSYWLAETTKRDYSSNGIKLSVTRAVKRNTYSYWDFSTIWTINEDESLPYLRDLDVTTSVNVSNIEGAVFFDGGDGSERNPFIIKTEAQLKAIKNNLTGNFKLGANITLNSNDNWEPIGDTTYYFSGNLDGDGYTISNLNINKSAAYAGLFGYTTAKIKNLKISNAVVSGTQYVGVLAGKNDGELSNIEIINSTVTGSSDYVGGLVGNGNAIIENSSVTGGSVTGNGKTGGLIGYSNYAVKNSYAINCTVTGTSYERVGGLIGYANSTVMLCYSNAVVTSANNYVGGLCGYSSGDIYKSYATGNVTGVSYVGGLTGRNDAYIENCFATGSATSNNGNYVAGLTGYNYSTINNSYAIGLVEGSIATYKGGLSNNGSSYNNSYWLPDTTGQATSSAGVRGSLTRLIKQDGYYNWDFDSIWKIDEGSSMAYLRELPRPDSILKQNISGVTYFEDGEGTKNDPYIIVNETQLKAINSNLSSYFKLGASFSLTQNESWVPLGNNSTYKFTGELDGDGYTISNLYINNTSNSYVGLFGYNEGIIKNLKINNVNISSSYGYVGALAGCTYGNGKIENVEVTNITIDGINESYPSYVGGLIGDSNREVDNCRTINGTITGNQYVGGLVGSYTGTINNSYSTVNVVGKSSRIGGLIGQSAGSNTVTKCYATGNVTGTGECVGGLIGYKSYGIITECYATGNVTENSNSNNVGGLIGLLETNANVSKCYATGNVSAVQSNNVGGFIGYVNMNTNYSIDNCFATGSVTGYAYVAGLIGRKNCNIVNCYSIGNVTGTSGQAGLVYYSQGGTATNSYWTPETSGIETSNGGGNRGLIKAMLYKNAYLNWNFTDVWQIDEETSLAYLQGLAKPSSVNLANISGYTNFTNGNGTKENPFMIYNEDQLKAINCGLTSYYKLANDIEIQGESNNWIPIGNGTYKFTGGFDGNNKTISNINIESTNSYTGFFGYSEGNVKNVNLDNVNISSTSSYVGSLIGYSTGKIENCSIDNFEISGTSSYTGGLIGQAYGSSEVSNCRAESGTVNGSSEVGGLIGYTDCCILDCYSKATVTGTNNNVGGLCGYCATTVERCYAIGSVTGNNTSSQKSNIGGLIGNSGGTVLECYATGDVISNYNYAGGLTGDAVTITNCFATGNVTGRNRVAGLTGSIGTITNCFAIGEVSTENNGTVGGLTTSGSANNSYWCPETTKQIYSYVGNVANLNGLKKKTFYNKWDFYNVWNIDEGTSIAYLRNITKPDSVLLSKIDSDLFFTNGDGTYNDPYIITNATQLSWIKYNMEGCYKLGCSFSASGVDWTPLGDSSHYFTGELDGQGYTISGLNISNENESYQGLFAKIDGSVHDINFSGCSVNGASYCGILAGYAKGTIENINITNSTASGTSYIGILVGQGGSTITNIQITGGSSTGTSQYIGGLAGSASVEGVKVNNVTVRDTNTGDSYVGGVVGSGNISYATTNATVISDGNYVGGLSGNSSGFQYVCATGNVSGKNYVGGLVGTGYGSYSYATGSVTGTENYIGGLCGQASYNLSYCYATGSVSGRYYIGGLIGWHNSSSSYGRTVSNCYSRGSVSGSSSVGGLIGRSTAVTISYSYTTSSNYICASGACTVQNTTVYPAQNKSMTSQETYTSLGWNFTNYWEMSTYPILKNEIFKVDYNQYFEQYSISTAQEFNNIRNKTGASYKLVADIDLSDLGEDWVPFDFSGYLNGQGHTISNLNVTVTSGRAGLFRYSSGIIKNLYVTNANVTGVGETGILVGYNSDTIENCYVKGNVNSTSGTYVGGLVGQNTGRIKKSSSIGNVIGAGTSIGGLVGRNKGGTIENCFTASSVQGNNNVGGLVGEVYNSTIINCYAIGNVSSTGNSFGGLIGYVQQNPTVTNSYFVPELNGIDVIRSGELGTPKQVTQMFRKATFENWNFGSIWNIDETRSMPYLRGTSIPNEIKEVNLVYDRSLLGNGTKENPYKIANEVQFMQIKYAPSAFYELTDDIDLSQLEDPFEVMCVNDSFTGKLDGKGYTISNFTYTTTSNYGGIFGKNNGEICNLEFENINITGRGYLGVIAGYADSNSNIYNITINNLEMYSSNSDNCGGITGYNYGTINNCDVSGEIETSRSNAGLLVGKNDSSGKILNCNTSGIITNTAQDNTGGLVGYNYGGIIRDSYSTATVTGKNRSGGLVGYASSGEITRCYATGSVTATGDYVGGLIGNNTGIVTECCALGNVNGSGDDIGGLIGYNTGNISNSFALGNVIGNSNVGGLIGYNGEGTLINSYALGNVSTNTAEQTTIGGLNGYYNNVSNITNSYFVYETAGQYNNSGGGTRITYQRLLNKDNYINWDFNDVWIIENNTPARLRNLNVSGLDSAFGRLNINVANYLSGEGTMFEPYVITTAEQLQSINSGLDKYYELGANIDLSGYDNWIPIGDDKYKFTGGLNGKGYTISNLTINRKSTYYQGLFGYIQDANIKNLKLVGVNIEGNAYVGGLVGRTENGTISNCEVKEGIIIGNYDNVGGLEGYQYGGEVKQCNTNVTITKANATTYVCNYYGGLIGRINVNVSDCYAIGSVTANGDYVGGLIGEASGNMTDCYATGNITAKNRVGGLAGYSGSNVEKCYALGSVTGNGDYIGGLVGYKNGSTINTVYATGNVISTGSNIGGLCGYQSGTVNNAFATGNVKGNGNVAGFIGDFRGTTNNCYATGKVEKNTTTSSINMGGFVGYVDNNSSIVANNSYYTPETTIIEDSVKGDKRNVVSMLKKKNYKTWDFENVWKIDEGQTFAYLQDLPKPQSILIGNFSGYTTFDFGDGSIDNPFIISTANQFNAIRNDLGLNYQLNDNISLSEYSNWTAIGDNTRKFTGKLDGNGFTVSDLIINKTSISYQGLFGYTSLATIKNLKLKDFDVSGYEYTGGLIGYSDTTVINNCEVKDSCIRGYSNYAGGLIGKQGAGEVINCNTNVSVIKSTNSNYSYYGGLIGLVSNSAVISDCYAVGSVTAGSYTGGLIGELSGILNNSYATGNVIGIDRTGGLVGNLNSGSMEMCYATGDINSTGSYAGGLLGYQNGNTINKVYATGDVVSTGSDIGGLIGYQSGTINNSFATGNVKGNGNVGGFSGRHNGTANYCYAIGKVEKNTTTSSISIGGFAGVNGTANYSYYTPSTTLQVESSCGTRTTLISLMQQNQYEKWDFYNVWNINENNTLAYIQGLPIPDSIKLSALSSNLEYSAGKGTKQSPFKVSTEAELLRVNYDLNKYYELEDNITISNGTNWTPIGKYSYLPFAGSFDGKGYKISGLTVNGTGSDYQGMFAYNIGEIKNVVLENPVISGSNRVGSLVGSNVGRIYNVGATGVQITGTGSYVGGLIGYSDTNGDSNVEMCYTTGQVGDSSSNHNYVGGLIGESYCPITKCYSTVDVYGNQYVGGLVGSKGSSLISECFATGSVTGKSSYIGGLVGRNNGGEVHFCYSTGAVSSSSTTNIGGLIGYSVNFTCNDCYWATDTSGKTTSSKGVAKTRAQLMNKATFEDWKFISVWNIEEGTTTPYLRNIPVPNSVY